MNHQRTFTILPIVRMWPKPGLTLNRRDTPPLIGPPQAEVDHL
jgi:hypothetical protein